MSKKIIAGLMSIIIGLSSCKKEEVDPRGTLNIDLKKGENSEVYIDDGLVGVVDYISHQNPEFSTKLEPGEYRIRVTNKEHINQFERKVRILESSALDLNVDLGVTLEEDKHNKKRDYDIGGLNGYFFVNNQLFPEQKIESKLYIDILKNKTKKDILVAAKTQVEEKRVDERYISDFTNGFIDGAKEQIKKELYNWGYAQGKDWKENIQKYKLKKEFIISRAEEVAKKTLATLKETDKQFKEEYMQEFARGCVNGAYETK